MFRLSLSLLIVLGLVLSTAFAQDRESLEANHIKVILKQKNNSLLNGQMNYAVAAAEMMVNGEKVTKLVKYSVCETKEGLSSFYTEKDDHALYIFSRTKKEGEDISVMNACHIIKNQEMVGQIDLVVSFSENRGYSLKSKQNVPSKETAMIAMCANEYEAKVLPTLLNKNDIAGNMLQIANYILTRVYGKISDYHLESMTSDTILKDIDPSNDPSARYSTRCLGRHSTYGLICIIGSFSGLQDCAKRAGECGCYEAIWYYTTVYMCTTICK